MVVCFTMPPRLSLLSLKILIYRVSEFTYIPQQVRHGVRRGTEPTIRLVSHGRKSYDEKHESTHQFAAGTGTKRLQEQYGSALLCVRYRNDELRGVRLKTVELIVEERPLRTAIRYRNEDIVSVVVLYTEKSLRDKLKAAGGTWNPDKKLWRVPFGVIRGDTELEGRIVKD